MTLDASPLSLNSQIPAPERRKRVLWKWSIVITVIVLGFLLWQCGSALVAGRALSNTAVEQFHTELNGEQYEQIFGDSDDGFQQSGNKGRNYQVSRGCPSEARQGGAVELGEYDGAVDYRRHLHHRRLHYQVRARRSGREVCLDQEGRPTKIAWL